MVNGVAKHVVSYMKDFLFTAEQSRTPLGKLSGGERGRLMLAQALAKPSNLLVFDEPTNDLDMETLDVLEEMLGDYAGTVLLISHDRDFLDRVVSGVIVPEGNGRWIEYAGGYSDMLVQRGADLTRAQPKPGPGRTAKPVVVSVVEQSSARRRMTFKDKHALETLPGTIAELVQKSNELQTALDDPLLYARDRAGFEKLTTELATIQRKLAVAEERWFELELLREELAGGSPA
jgi:ATP-binding cassette subfamily F protein uup